jgi:hypothetical protein
VLRAFIDIERGDRRDKLKAEATLARLFASTINSEWLLMRAKEVENGNNGQN